MRVHIVSPRINWSLSDVYDGLRYGLTANGAQVVPEMSGADVIIVVNGNLHDPETIREWRAIAPVYVLCTESPYDCYQEIERIAVADGGWTHERESVETLRAANPNVAYLQHAWHPERHTVSAPDASVPAHDVVFVGSGFAERVEWFNRIDWTGIDLGLYGLWFSVGLEDHLETRCVRQGVTQNAQTVALYRRAKMGLNLYRTRSGAKFGEPKREVRGYSLNPRAYELAACGVFHLSTYRSDVAAVFGDLVPIIGGTRDTAKADERIIRAWLGRDTERQAMAAQLPACVGADSWAVRAASVLQDLHAWSRVTA